MLSNAHLVNCCSKQQFVTTWKWKFSPQYWNYMWR